MAVKTTKHPLVEDFLQQHLSCDEDAVDRAFLVYQDLTEVRGWWNTELAYNSDLERAYVVGQRSRVWPKQVVLPMNVEEGLSLREVQEIYSSIYIDEEPIKNIIVAVSELDSSVVYYKLTSGLTPPDPPEMVTHRRQEKEQRMDKKRRHIASCVRQATERLSGAVS